jgi:hypothetical protein
LKSLPGISRIFSTGELSYSKVRALSRVANRQNEEKLLAFALRQADALVNVLKGYLHGEYASSHSDDYLVTIHVDQSALAGKAGRAALPIESVKRICCDSHAVVLTENERGEPLSIGRTTRLVPKSIARALRARDHGCCRWTFLRPDGIAVPDCGYSASDIVDHDDSGDYAMPPAGGLLSVAEKTLSEPAAPVYWH